MTLSQGLDRMGKGQEIMGSIQLNDGRTVYAHLVLTDQSVELLRQVRNECRAGFSYDTEEIARADQRLWWNNQPGTKLGLLYWEPCGVGSMARNLIGYGLLRQEGDKWYSSVGVRPSMSGKGYGGFITAHLIRRSVEPVYASARKDNPAACALHRAEDWEVTGEDDRLIYYKTRDDILTRPPRELRSEEHADNPSV